jgi:hypothetical protein
MRLSTQSAADCVAVMVRTFHHGYPYDQQGVTVRVTRPALVRRLAGFFPHLWDGRRSNIAGGWMASVSLDFVGRGGESHTVLIHPQFRSYSIRGDWPLHPEFKHVLIKLLRAADDLS